MNEENKKLKWQWGKDEIYKVRKRERDRDQGKKKMMRISN
jgi:hypothetical protein